MKAIWRARVQTHKIVRGFSDNVQIKSNKSEVINMR